MTTIKTSIFIFSLLFFFQIAIAQNISGKIIDSQTGESIPYATILVNNAENLVSNAEGLFTLSENSSSPNTMLTISYLGYANQKLSVGNLVKQQNIIKLQAGIIELKEVNVSNKRLSPYEIMANVKANIKNNYAKNSIPKKDMIFFREITNFKPSILDVEIDESSGFSKNALKTANAQMTAFTSKLIAQPPREYVDILCNNYSYLTTKDDKPYYLSKLEVLKATKLKNENSSTSLDDLQKSATDIILTHLDSTKYYRVKSGLFGSRDTISLRKDFNKKKRPKSNQLTSTKANLTSFLTENNITNVTKFDFIHEPQTYDYTFEGATYTNENEFVYVLSFKPKKSKSKYKGKLYISETDFAVIRADYKLEDGKKVNGVNLKLLLGIKAIENVSKGTVIYKNSPVGNGYYLQYALQEKGQYIYINRPLKFIELTDEDKDVVAFDLKVEGNSFEKLEYLNMNRSESSEATIGKITEDDFSFIKLKSYDPKIWKDYNGIEPLEEMKQFKAVD
ncbi:carboxypeptidase-like regulatory domain-containing protein [Flavobacterium sp. RSB2_4_14]|uniref:carboxypeptidase-like regulatory domain-containing protein n=1 Tax=Flavobacterium sp. RSB2_4_14 TaxID=3447665 RepID=UPI003F3EC646